MSTAGYRCGGFSILMSALRAAAAGATYDTGNGLPVMLLLPVDPGQGQARLAGPHLGAALVAATAKAVLTGAATDPDRLVGNVGLAPGLLFRSDRHREFVDQLDVEGHVGRHGGRERIVRLDG